MINVSCYAVEFRFSGQVKSVVATTLPEVLNLLKATFQMIDTDDRVTIDALLAVDSQRIGIANEVIKVPIFYGGQAMIERVLDNPDLLIKLD